MEYQFPSLETMPVEVTFHILSYIMFPRSTLPGLTAAQSHFTFPPEQQALIRDRLDMSEPMDNGTRAFDDMFSWVKVKHPYNALAATSTRLRMFVEWYCYSAVKARNIYNLPFDRLEAHGSGCVYPDMSRIVYRRLWLQTAPRYCVFCGSCMSSHPHQPQFRLMLLCSACFYAQAYSLDEVQDHYHIDATVLRANHVRGTPTFNWSLRVDVEALALRLYGTRGFHHTRRSVEEEETPCRICRDVGVNNDFCLRRSKRVLAGRITKKRPLLQRC